jgi:hypothetical protein
MVDGVQLRTVAGCQSLEHIMTDKIHIAGWIVIATVACLVAGSVMRPDLRDAVGGAVLQLF